MPTRRQYSGGGSAQTLTAGITSVALTATISDNSGWPDGSIGPFAVVLDRGQGTEEKILVASQAANTLTIQTRGYDGTGAQAHAGSSTVELCVTAVDLDEANAHTSASRGVHAVSGNVVGDTDSQSLSNKVLVSPIIADFTGANHDHSSAAMGGTSGLVTTPGASGLQAHFGTASLSPGGSTIVFAHGAPFTPLTGFISGSANVSFTSIVITSYGGTNLSVAFFDANSNTPLSVATCSLSFVVFG